MHQSPDRAAACSAPSRSSAFADRVKRARQRACARGRPRRTGSPSRAHRPPGSGRRDSRAATGRRRRGCGAPGHGILEHFVGLELEVEEAGARPGSRALKTTAPWRSVRTSSATLSIATSRKVLRLLECGVGPGAVRGFALTRAVAVGTAERVRIAPDVRVGQHDVAPCRVERRRIEAQVRLEPERDALEGFRGDELRLRRADESGDSWRRRRPRLPSRRRRHR